MVEFPIILLITAYCVAVKSDNSTFRTDNVSNRASTVHFADILQKASNVLQLLPGDLLPKVNSEECEEHLQMYLENVKSAKPWALQMFDSSGKLPDLLFEGNVFQLGNVEECIAQSEPDGLFNGKFCLPKFSLAPDVNFYELLSFINFTNSPIQYIKGNSSTIPAIAVGMCIPSSCTVDDLKEILSNILTQLELPFSPVLDENDCSTNEIEGLVMGDWLAIGILFVITAAIISSSFYDIFSNYTGKWRGLYVSFSVYTNGKKLFNLETDKSLSALNGIRFISMFWILLAHTHIFTVFESKNMLEASKESLTWKKVFIMNAFLGVDTFLVLSGLLLSCMFLNYMENRKLSDFNIFGFYLHRYLRLTPALAVMILLQATILKHLGSGPLWKSGVEFMAEPCRNYWWMNILYIHNYFKVSPCIVPLWYLAVDTQLYLLSPIILIPLWKSPKYTISVLTALVFIGIAAVFSLAYMNEERFVMVEVYRQMPENSKNYVLDILRQLNLAQTYVTTYARFPPWIIGIILGFIIHKYIQRDIKLSKIILAVGWISAIILTVGSLHFVYPFIQLNYEYNAIQSSIYLALHRVTWSVGVSWIIFACVSGHGGLISKLLSLKIWVPLSRLTYCIYLTHFTILTMRYSGLEIFTPLYATEFFLTVASITVSSLIAALFLSLMFEAPFIAISNFLLRGRKKHSSSEMKMDKVECAADTTSITEGD